MTKLMSGFLATALAASFAAASFVPANAAPLSPTQIAPTVSDTASNIQDVQYRRYYRDRGSYWRGHRGYRHWRPGYRRHGDFWFPLAAFATGAIISGAIANDRPPPRVYRGGNAHVQWCYNRYRSYRASDNTFQPYNGPRRQCVSPY